METETVVEENEDNGSALPVIDKTMETETVVEENEDFGISLPILHRTKGPLKSCYVTADLCLRLIHEAMRKKQWEKASGLLSSYFQTLESRHTTRQQMAPEIIWRLGSEILLNHPKCTRGDINVFHEAMKNIGLRNYLGVSLEQVYHSLCNGDYDEAYRVLSLAESWRCGRLAVRQKPNQRLVQGYRAALNYRSWVNRRASSSRADGQSQSSGAQAVGSHYRQATVTFQEIIKLPGLWDPFVLSYVDLLESSGEREEAEKVLKAYASNPKNPPNPNAHVFLYEFKKRNTASDEELKKVLAPLYSMTPSHTLMVNYSYLLSTSSSAEDVKMALKVLFDLLDFSGWKNNLKAWSFLAKEIKKALHNDHKDWVLEYWEPRSSWWSPYHFTKLHAKRDWKENVDLALKKALVAGMLLGLSCPYLLSVCKSGKDEERRPLRHIIKTVQKNNCAKKF